MSVEPQRRVSIEDYLAAERRAETKSEYLDGEVFAMSGASREHNLIAVNVTASVHGQLKGSACEIYAGDMRVHVPATGLYTYPDVTVVCGEPRFEDGEEVDTLLNPTLLIEVLSPTTEGCDRGKKFAHYRTLESFREYVLIAQEEVRVELFTRQEDGHWLLSEASRLEERLPLASIGCELRLADVYDRVIDSPT
jgi:Uma2 family endonuclease